MKRTNKACERVFIRECKTTRLMLKLKFDGVIDMKIREVNENKKQFIALLLHLRNNTVKKHRQTDSAPHFMQLAAILQAL